MVCQGVIKITFRQISIFRETIFNTEFFQNGIRAHVRILNIGTSASIKAEGIIDIKNDIFIIVYR